MNDILTVKSLWNHPLSKLFWVIFTGALLISIIFDKRAIGFIGVLSGMIPVIGGLSIKIQGEKIHIHMKDTSSELLFMLLSYTGYVFYLTWTCKNDKPFSDFLNWIPFICIPGIFLWIKGYSRDSVGFTKKNFKPGFMLFLVVCVGSIPSMLLFLASESRIENFIKSIHLIPLIFSVAFLFAFLGPAITEEFFFRALLLERMAQYVKSDMGGIMIVALLNALYHLPFAFFLESWPTKGNLPWALSAIITEQALTAITFGILWVKTRNIIPPALFHAFIDAFLFSAYTITFK